MYSGTIKSLLSILTSRAPFSKKIRPISEDTRIDVDEFEQTDVTESASPTGSTGSGEEYQKDGSELEAGDAVYECF